MSWRSTLFLTDDNVHWYENTMYVDEKDGEEGYRVVIEIPAGDIKDWGYTTEDGLTVEVNGASLLAQKIRQARDY